MSVAADNFPAAPFFVTLATALGGTSLGVVEVTAKSGTTFTLASPGAPQTIAAGASVELRVMAEHIIELQDAAAIVSPQGDYILDTKNLRDANASGKKVILKAGTFFIEGDGTEIIKKTTPEIWEGAGMGATFLKVRSTVPNTRDIFRIVPVQYDAIGYRNRGYQLRDFAIIPENQSGRYGRHGINFDQTDAQAWFTSHFDFHHLHIDYLGGNSIYANNGGKLDGYFCVKISDNLFWSGVKLVGAGDSITIKTNTISGENVALDIQVRAQANVCKIEDNNLTARGGSLKFDGDRLRFIDNNCEMFDTGGHTPTVEPVACVYIGGSAINQNHRIQGNTIFNILGTATHACQIDNSYMCEVSNNRFVGSSGNSASKDLVIGASSSNTIIYPSNYYYKGQKVDNGAGTVYVS